MPYITKDRRKRYDKAIDVLVGEVLDSYDKDDNSTHYYPGDLNYIVTRIVTSAYLKTQELNYRAASEMVGVFENAKLELYRRLVAPYEDKKIKENGDYLD